MTFSGKALHVVSFAAMSCLAGCGTSDGPLDNPSVATAITIKDGNLQSADLGARLATNPSVLVTGGNGAGIPGVSVVFSHVNGDGAITDSVVVTDANGVATLGGWTMGSIEGANTIHATVAGLDPVLFIETAFDPCTHVRVFPMPGQLVGVVSEQSGCSLAATTAVDSFSLVLPQQQAFKVTIGPTIETASINFTSIPADSATGPLSLVVNPGVGGTFNVILPAGAYRGSVSSFTNLQAHTLMKVDYAITVEKTAEDAGQCNPLIVIRKGVVTSQTITATDCIGVDGANPRYDSYRVHLHHGEQYTFTAQTTSAKELEFYRPDLLFPVKNTGNTNPTTSTITVTANVDGDYELRVVAADAAHFGPYTLQSVQSGNLP